MTKKNIKFIALILVATFLCVCLVACGSKDYEKKLNEKGYTVTTYVVDDTLFAKAKWAIIGEKDSDYVIVAEFKNADDLVDEENTIETTENNRMYYKNKGNILIAGTKQGVADAKN